MTRTDRFYISRRMPIGEYVNAATASGEADARARAVELSGQGGDVLVHRRDADHALARYRDGVELIDEDGPPWPLKGVS
jgi:hypothetical protein